ncbi:MAG: hypothetical protein Q4C95_03370 [Planctomycetia bacterium]|nr:hypothetical protein [Planctomycetia bacterium]
MIKTSITDYKKELSSKLLKFRKKITCPHCWTTFKPHELLSIAVATEYVGDEQLGTDVQMRFLPCRFDIEGHPLDPEGIVCRDYACPNCHLILPRDLIEFPVSFISIIGAPSSGKSYFLASMLRRAKIMLSTHFQTSVIDTHAKMNDQINDYEQTLFLRKEGVNKVIIEKTREYGEGYNTSIVNGQIMRYPQPYMFTLTPSQNHIFAKSINPSVLCLYDNAGESFLPGRESSLEPVTDHLKQCGVFFYIFDPLQYVPIRTVCRQYSKDPQLEKKVDSLLQHSILSETIHRIKKSKGLDPSQKVNNPVFVIATKADVWKTFLGDANFNPPYGRIQSNNVNDNVNMYAVKPQRIQNMSNLLRDILFQYVPEFVMAIENLSSDVTYFPVSATGCSPIETTMEQGVQKLEFDVNSIDPIWSEVPLFYALTKIGNIIPFGRSGSQDCSSDTQTIMASSLE